MIHRRGLLLGAALLAAPPGLALHGEEIEVWRDPTCDCCAGWVDHLRREGFAITDRVVPSVAPFRHMLGTPSGLLSCHAGRVGGFALEGHVPALAIRRLLAERPEGVAGLAVPAMPIGTPGMEMPGQPAEIYEVIAWQRNGALRPFLRMRGAAPA